MLTEVAVITKPKGLKGELNVHILEDFQAEVLTPGPVFLSMEGQQIPYLIESLEIVSSNMVRMKLKNVDTPEVAESLRKVKMLLPSERAEPFKTAESELISFDVFDDDHHIGKVKELLSTKAQDLISVITDEGVEVLIPFVDAFIVEQDNVNQKLILNLPEGLVDLNR